MLNNLGSTRSVQKKNNWSDEKQCSQVESQQNDSKLNESIYSGKWYLYSKEESEEITKGIANTNINKKELDKIKGFETIYRIPIRSYMWDILGLLRTNNRIKSQNIDLYLKWLPCGGGTFKNYFRFGVNNSPFAKDNKISTPQQIKSLLNCAKQEYRKDLLPIPLPNELNYKINGIWEMDVRIFRAINFNINRLEWNKKECEMHISMWSHGPKKNNNKYDDEKKNDNDSDDDDDDDDEIEYDELDDEKDADYEILKIIEDCRNINIEDVMKHNTNKNVIKCVRRLTETNSDEHKNNNQDDTNLNDGEYENIETFIDRICEKEAYPESGDSVMMLFDTRNTPKVSVYIWRERINKNKYTKNVNIGDNRIHNKTNKKRKCFEFNAPNNTDSDKKINIGQYIGMDICMLESSVHQFWTIFNAETRFETDHVLSLWRDYYSNETIFEVSSKLDDEFDEYKEDDIEKRKLYETYYSKEFVDKLNDRTAILNEKELLLQKEKLIYNKDNKMPDLNKYKPFKFHWRRAQYVKYYGKSFISKLNDKTTKFDKDELWLKKHEGLSNEKAPLLDKYGAFKFHWKRTEEVDNFERELTESRPIINLSPKGFKQFYFDATNHSQSNDKS